MKKCTSVILLPFVLMVILATSMSCEKEPEMLHVWFANSESDFSITSLYVKTETGSWTSSFIPTDQVLATNQYFEFDIPLKQGTSTEYYVTVLKNSTTMQLLEDPLENPLSILHWSSPIRYKHITITSDSDGNPVVTGEGGADYSLDEFSAYTKATWQ